MAAKEITLTVNDKPIALGDFVGPYLENIVRGIIASLKGTGEIRNLKLFIDSDGKVAIILNGAAVSLKPFPNEIIKRTLFSVVGMFKGAGPRVSTLQITISA